MKVLHTFSNWKWTGPAEPAVRLAEALARECEVDFACGRCPYPDLEDAVAKQARAAGLALVGDLRLRKHFDPLFAARDYRRLRELIRERDYDVVHAHLLNDHLLAGAAVRRAGLRARIVRTVYGGRDLAPRLRSRLAFSRLVDGVIAASSAAAEVVRRGTRLPDERLFVVDGAVDVARFAPRALAALRTGARAELGLDEGAVAVGIVARVQSHRRFELLFESFAQAAREAPALRLVVIGRGTEIEALAHRPVERLGIADKVRFPGYREGARYEALLAALDLGVFLVPGSDGSCRAAREMMAAGLPLVATQRPPLPEIVEHGISGFALSEDVDAFAGAFVRLAEDAASRTAMAAAARSRAVERFSIERQAQAVAAIYRRLTEMPPWRS